MPGNPQAWVSRDSVPWGDAPVDRTPGLRHDGPQTGCLNKGSVWEHEVVKVVLTNTGPGQAFLVASSKWGAVAAPAAEAAYGEIARVLQDQGLTIVHERLFGASRSSRQCWLAGPRPLVPATSPWMVPSPTSRAIPPGETAWPGSSSRRCPAAIPG